MEAKYFHGKSVVGTVPFLLQRKSLLLHMQCILLVPYMLRAHSRTRACARHLGFWVRVL